MTELTHCPSCARKLRVPNDLFGKLVKCPGCYTTFTAAPRGEPEIVPPLPDGREKNPTLPDPTEEVRKEKKPQDENLDEDFRPWDRQGEVRRDCEPHRGPLVLTLGIISVSLTPLILLTACCVFVGAPVMIASLALGISSWIMGQSDLSKMSKGLMDPAGRSKTQAGMICGIIGTAISGLCGLGEGSLLIVQLSLR